MVIIAYRLAQGWAGPGGFTVMTGRVPSTVYFKLLWLSQQALYLINTQSWSYYLHPDKVYTNMSGSSRCQQPHLHLSNSLHPSDSFSVSYRYFPLRSIQCVIPQASQNVIVLKAAHITAIDSSQVGPAPTFFNICAMIQQGRDKPFEIKMILFEFSCSTGLPR